VIKHEFPKTSVIALSNQTEDFFIQEMLDAGAAGYLTKSAHPKQIERSIRDACSEE
jgi:DNA-binding NarL/FixJ family response regulator